MPTPNVLLRHERQLRGWSQAYLAEQIDVPDYYISRWERGEVLPSPYYQQKLCQVFGKTAEELGMLQQTTPLPLRVDPPKVEQLPFPQPQLDSISTPQPPVQPHPKRKGKSPVFQALVILVLFSAGLGTILFSRLSSVPESPVVGHLYFLSSGQTSMISNQGIADKVQIEIQSPQSPSAGKSYYAWLEPDEAHPENSPFLLGKVVISNGTGTVSYSNPQHTNLLAVTSQLLITEQDASVTPLASSTDKGDWRYIAEIPQQPNPKDLPHHYSLLDHLRHLLASDPTLEEYGYHGGIDIWLFRNAQQVYNLSIDAVNNWQSERGTNVSLIRQDTIRILDYLDGIDYVQRDVPASTPYQVHNAAPRSTFGLLQFFPIQPLPGYLQHMSIHLNGVANSPGASDLMRNQAAQILASANNVNKWFEQIRRDALQLVAMKDVQQQNEQTSTLLNDIANNANFALNGEIDPVTGRITSMGAERMYFAIQSLATMDITQFKE
jgi:transcriptional regulator with XRE-family HTH domain